MRRFLFVHILLFVVGILTLQAQITPTNPFGDKTDEFGNLVDQFGNPVDPSMRPQVDSTQVDFESLPPRLYMWHVSKDLGNVEIVAADTARLNYQNTSLTEGTNGSYNHLGNMGTPRLSRIFFDRKDNESSIFIQPYSYFFVQPEQFFFTNSNVPFSNLTYFKGGNKINGEERFKAYFSVNVNKQLAFGFNFDYLYGRGYYNHSGTSFFNAAPFISYMGDRYEGTLLYSYNYLKSNQNGGLTDDRYITNPEDVASGSITEPTNMPTLMSNATNRIANSYVFLTQRYKMGFHRNLPQAENDTLPPKKEFVPVTSLIHTMKVDWSNYKFTSTDKLQDYYPNTYIDPDNANIMDSTSHVSVRNTLGISLLEGFNKYAKMGLTAFASYKISKYTLMTPEEFVKDHMTENEFYVGGEISKKSGSFLHYHAFGEVGLMGKAIGQFDIHGDADVNFRLGKDTISVIARGGVSNQLAPFYMRHYHSKHFYWDNDLEKIFKTRIEGEIKAPRWGTQLKAGVENIKNYAYFNQQAVPDQFSGNIQVLSATLKQDFKLGIFHLDGDITWQKSSNQTILPLPDFSIYGNFYIDAKLAKNVLSVQLGADVRYFTKYYAPGYMAAIGQFFLQPEDDLVEIGNYPIINVYANIHLKRTRIYAMMYHVNQGMINRPNAFYAPHYPINPRFFRFGISWNFYD